MITCLSCVEDIQDWTRVGKRPALAPAPLREAPLSTGGKGPGAQTKRYLRGLCSAAGPKRLGAVVWLH